MKTKRQIARDHVIEDLFAVVRDLVNLGDLSAEQAKEALRQIRETEMRMIEIENEGVGL